MAIDLLSVLLDGMMSGALPAPPLPLPPLRATGEQLGDNKQSWRNALLGFIEGHLAPRYRDLPGHSVPGAPGGVPRQWNLPPQLRQVMSAASTLAGWTEPVLNELDSPPGKRTRYDYKLRTLQRAGDIAAGFDLLGRYLTSQSLPASATESRVVARQALESLVAFNAFLIRLGGCITAASVARVSLAEALALYRTEGDLIAPMSSLHLKEGWPCRDHDLLESISLGNSQIDHGANIIDTMQRGLWSCPFASLKPPRPNLPDLADRPKFEPQIKSGALQDLMVVIAGMDFLFGLIPFIVEVADIYKDKVKAFEAIGAPSYSKLTRDTVTRFMLDNRAAAGLPAALKDQQDAFDAILNDLEVRWPGDAAGRIVAVPKHPERLVAFTLTEALLFFRRNKDQGQGPYVEPPAKLRYLAYNTQHRRSNTRLEDDLFAHLLASAAVAANKHGNKPEFAALRAKLMPLGLAGALNLDPKVNSSEHVAEFKKLAGFLSTAADFDLLADYILRAPLGPWFSFGENRANAARYQKLLAYYAALLA